MKLNYEFSIQEVADKFVAVAKNPETETVEQVFNLNESGAVILKALQEGKDVPAIVACCCHNMMWNLRRLKMR